jgi:hypothetical protein
MDQNRLAVLTRSLGGVPSRRDVLRGLVGAGLGAGSLALLGSDASQAKRRRKHKTRKPQTQAPTCGDGRQNGAETDVDCGGTCPRCGLGKTCASRNDCTTALCVDGACAEPASPAECGQDTDGSNCATRTNAAGQKICTRIDGRFFGTGTCEQLCLATEQCVLPVSGGVECVLPCGAPAA